MSSLTALGLRIDCLTDEVRLLAEAIRLQGAAITTLTAELAEARECSQTSSR